MSSGAKETPYDRRECGEDVICPELQGHGFGEKIVAHAIKCAKSRDVGFIELTSNPKRTAANGLYRKLGFFIPETNLYRLYFQ